MAAKDLGTKFSCFKCGAKFYDLKKPEPICPRCGADQREMPVAKPGRRSKEKEPAKVAPAEVEEAAGAEDEAEEADEDEDEPEEDF